MRDRFAARSGTTFETPGWDPGVVEKRGVRGSIPRLAASPSENGENRAKILAMSTSPGLAPRLPEVERFIDRFPDVPQEAIFKEDLLRLGVGFSEDALRVSSGFKPKSYFIFSFDLRSIPDMQRDENLRAPEELALVGGPREFRRTIVSVRINPASPYEVDIVDGRLSLVVDGETVCEVQLQETPEYYRRDLRCGKTVTEIAPTIEWGYLVYLTVYRKCQYFGFKEECQFCDINENWRQQTAGGRPNTTVKTVDEVIEALEIIDELDTERRTGAYTITGGSITRHLGGRDEASFYEPYARAINERFPDRWLSKMVVQALPRDDVRRFRDAGVQIYHPNYEIWDERLFPIICPGKESHVGRDEWMRRIVDAADVFGPAQVIPNFVAGIEMAKPHGYEAVDEALASTARGLEFFMSKGITPRFTVWCPEPLSVLGKDQGPAPLEYHVGLLRLWRQTHERHGLPAPAGYGPPGAGNAVFSVSSFMDAISPDTPVAEPPYAARVAESC